MTIEGQPRLQIKPLEQEVEYLAQSIIRELTAGKRVLWAVPGGSGIAVAVEAAKRIAKVPHEHLTVVLTDERYGPVGHADSNWQQLLQKEFDLPQAKLLPVLSPDDESIEMAAQKFDAALRDEFEKAQYKIALIGVGADGHTLGILPGSSAVNSPDLVEGYKTKIFERITMTFNAIRKFDEVVVHIQGEEKWKVVDQLKKSNLPQDSMPAQVIKWLKAKVTIFSDYKG